MRLLDWWGCGPQNRQIFTETISQNCWRNFEHWATMLPWKHRMSNLNSKPKKNRNTIANRNIFMLTPKLLLPTTPGNREIQCIFVKRPKSTMICVCQPSNSRFHSFPTCYFPCWSHLVDTCKPRIVSQENPWFNLKKWATNSYMKLYQW